MVPVSYETGLEEYRNVRMWTENSKKSCNCLAILILSPFVFRSISDSTYRNFIEHLSLVRSDNVIIKRGTPYCPDKMAE